MAMGLTLNELKSIIEKMEEENVERVCMDFYGYDAIEFNIWKDGEYIKTIFRKKYWQTNINDV